MDEVEEGASGPWVSLSQCVGVVVTVAVFLVVRRYLSARAKRRQLQWRPEDRTYLNPITQAHEPLAVVTDDPSLYLSIVVPAYEEEERLDVMMESTMSYLEARLARDSSFTYEVLIVDDGSKDRTSAVALEWSRRYGCGKVRVLRLTKNRGKGGAVRRGMLQGRGQYLLFTDADGATAIEGMEGLERQLRKNEKNGLGVAVGSRYLNDDDDNEVTRTFFRQFISKTFKLLVSLLCVKGIRDTQCGFKMFSRRSARLLFTSLHVERWAFDVELLYMARVLGMPITEVQVTWTEIDGSKISPMAASLQMARDLLRIRVMHWVGVWAISE